MMRLRRQIVSGKKLQLPPLDARSLLRNPRPNAEGVTISFVSRYLRLAYLSPVVLGLLVTERRPCAISIEALANAATLPWVEQVEAVFSS